MLVNKEGHRMEGKDHDIVYSYRFIQKSYHFLDLESFRIIMIISSYNPCFLSQNEIAKQSGVSIATVKRRLLKLVSNGLLLTTSYPDSGTKTYAINREKIEKELYKYAASPSSQRATPLAQPELPPSSQRATKVQIESTKFKVIDGDMSQASKKKFVDPLIKYKAIVDVAYGSIKVSGLNEEDVRWWDNYIRTTTNPKNKDNLKKALTNRFFSEKD